MYFLFVDFTEQSIRHLLLRARQQEEGRRLRGFGSGRNAVQDLRGGLRAFPAVETGAGRRRRRLLGLALRLDRRRTQDRRRPRPGALHARGFLHVGLFQSRFFRIDINFTQ